MAKTVKRVLMPLPAYDFDPSEAALTWKILKENGADVHFATPEGKPAKADARMLYGTGLSVFKHILMARKDAVDACLEMYTDANFKKPLPYKKVKDAGFDGLVLPGGHAPGMRVYLESLALQNLTSVFFAKKKPVGAICHGVVLAARAKRKDGKSVLFGKKTTALLKKQEMAAYNLTRVWLGAYYRTYPETTVQDEVTAALAAEKDFLSGPTPGLTRDAPDKMKRGFTVTDGNYISARWPGDAYNFAKGFLKLIHAVKY
jgi:protease I